MLSDPVALVGPARPALKSCRWRNQEEASIVSAHELAAAFMDHPVVPVAEKCQVGKIAGPVMDPVSLSVMLRMTGGLAPQWTSRGGFHLNCRPSGMKRPAGVTS